MSICLSQVLRFTDRRALYGCNIGHIDAHLLAVVLTPETKLWTKKLPQVVRQLALAL